MHDFVLQLTCPFHHLKAITIINIIIIIVTIYFMLTKKQCFTIQITLNYSFIYTYIYIYIYIAKLELPMKETKVLQKKSFDVLIEKQCLNLENYKHFFFFLLFYLFQSKFPFLYRLKSSEYFGFMKFSGGIEMEKWPKMG